MQNKIAAIAEQRLERFQVEVIAMVVRRERKPARCILIQRGARRAASCIGRSRIDEEVDRTDAQSDARPGEPLHRKTCASIGLRSRRGEKRGGCDRADE
jgi:hypothetical protein